MSADGERAPGKPRAEPDLHRLSFPVRAGLWVVGLLLIAIGIAGLVLPGIQGVLTIAIGVAVLSLASDTAHRLLRRALARWPGLAEKVERWRRKLHRRVARRGDRER